MRAQAWAVVAIAAALVLAGCTADAPAPDQTSESTDNSDSRLPPPADPLALDEVAAFGAVASMNAGSNCTGTLIDTGVAAGPAYVLTNGHCVGDVGRSAQTTTLHEQWSGTAEFFRAAGNLESTVMVDVAELAYSSMRHTDTAIVRLDSTLAELEGLGVEPLPITASEPAAGDAVVNVGVPVQGLDHDDWVMRRGECTLDAQHTLIEFLWLWFDVWANDCPGILQGSSGSPLLTVDADGAPVEIVAMINTTSWGVSAADGGACTISRPCQLTDDGPVMLEETSYAQSVAGLGRCFDSVTGEFSAGGSCPLPVSDIWAEQGGGVFRGAGQPDGSGRLPEVSFVGAATGVIRTALVPLGDGTACTDRQTYAGSGEEVLPHAGKPWELRGIVVAADLPEQEGHYLLCAVRGEGYAAAASVLFEVDRTPPLFPAGADVERLDGGGAIIRPYLNPPELSTVRFIWGAPGTLDCTDTAAFQDFFIAPLTLEARDLPARYCIYGMDAAGNPTPVTTIDIPAG